MNRLKAVPSRIGSAAKWAVVLLVILQGGSQWAPAAIYRWDNGALITNQSAVPHADFTDFDLSFANLDNADMHHSILRGSTLADARLRWANLTSADCFQADFTNADLAEADLTSASVEETVLTNANFRGAILTEATFSHSVVTDAVFSGAVIRGAYLNNITDGGFTAAQFYSTADYASGDLQEVNLDANDMVGWDFADKDLAGASLSWANLTNADFSGANLTEVYFDEANLTNADLTGANLSRAFLVDARLAEADLAGADLTHANVSWAIMTNAVLSGAAIQEARFWRATETGFTAAQLYATASHCSGDLRGVDLRYNNLSDWDFSGQNLADARFDYCTLDGTEFTSADLRGATFSDPPVHADGAIDPDGTVARLVLGSGESRTFWDYNGDTAIAVLVENEMNLNPDASIEMLFEDTDWGSTMSFEPGTQVSLGGTLVLGFAPGVHPEDLVGATFGLFDWAGVAPLGQSFTIVTDPNTIWDTSDLYTTGNVTLIGFWPGPNGDFNDDGNVNGDDLLAWRNGYGTASGAVYANGDADRDGDVDGNDFMAWQRRFSPGTCGESPGGAAVPEPGAAVLALLAAATILPLTRPQVAKRAPRRVRV